MVASWCWIRSGGRERKSLGEMCLSSKRRRRRRWRCSGILDAVHLDLMQNIVCFVFPLFLLRRGLTVPLKVTPPPRTQSADFLWKMCSRTCRSIISFPYNPHHSEMILIYTGIWIKIGGESPKSFPSKSFRSDENMHWISQLEQKELWKYCWWEIDIRQL